MKKKSFSIFPFGKKELPVKVITEAEPLKSSLEKKIVKSEAKDNVLTEVSDNDMIKVQIVFSKTMYGIFRALADIDHKTMYQFLIDNMSPEFKERAARMKSFFNKTDLSGK